MSGPVSGPVSEQRTEPRLADIQPAPSVDDLLQSATGTRTDEADPGAVTDTETGADAVPITWRRPMASVPEPEPEPEPEQPADPAEHPSMSDAAPKKPAGRTKVKTKAKTKTPVQPPAPEPEMSAHPIPDFYPSQQEPVTEHASAGAAPMVLPVARLDPTNPGGGSATTAPSAAENAGQLGLTVQEVADAAIERLHDAENATLRHLAALETEALRRAELLTAQAELDAELIRLTARREAHAIISAARARTGAGTGAAHLREMRQLGEISDAVSRFAESIDAGLAPPHEDEERP